MEQDNKRKIFIGTHIMVWVVLFSLPYLLASGEAFNLQRLLKHSTIPLLYYAVIFYVNYLILIDKYLFTPQKGVFVISNVLIIALLIFLNHYIKQEYFAANISRAGVTPRPVKLSIYIDMISMLIPLIFSIGLKTYERWVKSEAAHQQASNEKLISELQHLKYQLQPHFFFNSLNNIYSLIDRHPDKAKETVHSLGKLMRYLLYETNAPTVSLTKEIDFMKKYIELMKLRISDNTTVTTEFPVVSNNVEVAPLLFISLVENAFKHGVSATQSSDLDFKMSLDGEELVFVTKNIHLPKDLADKSGSGIGLDNLEKRLKLLYPEAHEFKTEITSGFYVSVLKIQHNKYTS